MELAKKMTMYHFADRDEYPEEIPGYVFETSLTLKQIKKINRQAEKEIQKEGEESDYKLNIMIKLMKKEDKKFKEHKLKVAEF